MRNLALPILSVITSILIWITGYAITSYVSLRESKKPLSQIADSVIRMPAIKVRVSEESVRHRIVLSESPALFNSNYIIQVYGDFNELVAGMRHDSTWVIYDSTQAFKRMWDMVKRNLQENEDHWKKYHNR